MSAQHVYSAEAQGLTCECVHCIRKAFADRAVDVEHVETRTEKDGRTSFMSGAIRGDRMRVVDGGFVVTLSELTDNEIGDAIRAQLKRDQDELHEWERHIVQAGEPWAHPSRAL